MDITIPYNYSPTGKYSYQRPLYNCLRDGYKRAIAIWHRRGGKDKTLWNLTIKEAFKRVGIYYYFFPTYTQGKKIIWDGIDEDGFRFLNHIPDELMFGTPNGTELKVQLVDLAHWQATEEKRPGSIVQIIGTDNFDSIRGTNPIGCVFSEYAFQDPRAYDVVRPILKKNGGWAIFNTTPNGENHALDLYEMAQNNPNWFSELLTIDDTGVVSEADIEEERAEGMTEEMIQQEYYCSFEAGSVGSYYNRVIKQAVDDGRIGEHRYNPNHLVTTAWDVGVNDSTSIWFFQEVENTIRFIDYYEYNDVGMAHYVNILKEKGYNYKQHFLPHDAGARIKNERADRIVDILQDLGLRRIKLLPRTQNILSDINLVRATFPEVYISAEACAAGLRALRNYHKVYDHKRKVFRNKPDHDWSSHASDAFRYAILGYKGMIDATITRARVLNTRGLRKFTAEGETAPDPFKGSHSKIGTTIIRAR